MAYDFDRIIDRRHSDSATWLKYAADVLPLWVADMIRWVRQTWDAMQPFSLGAVYVNYLGQAADEGTERIKEAYSVVKYEWLLALKKQYDPTNLFRLNQNIDPLV